MQKKDTPIGGWTKNSVIYSGGPTLGEAIKADTKETSIPLSRFYYERVWYMKRDPVMDVMPGIAIAEDGSVEIYDEMEGRRSLLDVIRIDAEGNILTDGDLEYVKALKERRIKVILDRENIKKEDL